MAYTILDSGIATGSSVATGSGSAITISINATDGSLAPTNAHAQFAYLVIQSPVAYGLAGGYTIVETSHAGTGPGTLADQINGGGFSANPTGSWYRNYMRAYQCIAGAPNPDAYTWDITKFGGGSPPAGTYRWIVFQFRVDIPIDATVGCFDNAGTQVFFGARSPNDGSTGAFTNTSFLGDTSADGDLYFAVRIARSTTLNPCTALNGNGSQFAWATATDLGGVANGASLSGQVWVDLSAHTIETPGMGASTTEHWGGNGVDGQRVDLVPVYLTQSGTNYNLFGGAYSDLNGAGTDTVASSKTGGGYSNLDGAGSETVASHKTGGAFADLDGSGTITTLFHPSGGATSDLDASGSVAVASAKTGGAFADLSGSGSVFEFLPPDPPVVACAARGLTSVGITWTDAPGTNPISYYEVSIDGAAPIITTSLAYTFTSLASGTCFNFAVRGVDDHGTIGAWSAPVTCCTTIASVTGVRLGCGLYTVYVLERGGGTIVAELPFTGLSWTRMLDDTSAASVAIDGLSGAEGAKCCATLRGITPWEHEIGIYRNGERVWAGPYVSAQLRSSGSALDARDLSIWPFRRVIHNDHLFVNTDLADIFAAYVVDAMSVDNSPGLVVTPSPTGIRGKRTVLASMKKTVGPLLKELDRTGIDWTVIDRAMVVGGTAIVTPSIGLLTDSHFAVEPDVYLDGLSQATDVYTRGAGGGAKGAPILGHAFDVAARAKYGWLEIAPRERLIEDDTSALVSADSRLQLIRDTPAFISQARLSPDAPVEMRTLVPGAVADVRLTYTCFPVVGLHRLHDVTVTLGKDSAEVVDVTFQPIGTNEEPSD